MLLARAGNCAGDCPTRDSDIAAFLYSDQPAATALDALDQAVAGGGAWSLANSDLSIRKGCSRDASYSALAVRSDARLVVDNQPEIIPTTAAEREDFSWVAAFRKICPTGCDLNPAVLGPQPPSSLIAARLHLRGGSVFTYSIARNGSNVMPVHFERLDGVGGASPYSQALATWVEADVQISGSTVEISEQTFDGFPGRSMSLAPNANGVVEMAVLNLPPFAPPPPAGTIPNPGAGKHFQAYYDLMQTPPAKETRAVPQPVGSADNLPVVSWDDLHPRQPLFSELLSRLRLEVGRGVYDQTICPMVQYP
ncbi:MAG TPA: hypothetical protein VI670_25060 [Thermoanaerobaculia bacterium]